MWSNYRIQLQETNCRHTPCDMSQQGDKSILSAQNTFLPFSHTRKCHYQCFRRCKDGTCCSSFCNFATRVRMDWDKLFVIVMLSTLLPVSWSSWLAQSSFSVVSSLIFSLYTPWSFYLLNLNFSFLFVPRWLTLTSFHLPLSKAVPAYLPLLSLVSTTPLYYTHLFFHHCLMFTFQTFI